MNLKCCNYCKNKLLLRGIFVSFSKSDRLLQQHRNKGSSYQKTNNARTLVWCNHVPRITIDSLYKMLSKIFSGTDTCEA